MRGLGSLNVGVLILACIFALCEAGPSTFPPSLNIPLNPFSDWAKQSGSFAASILNVKWLYNIAAQGAEFQPASGGRYRHYRLWFRAYNYATSSVVKCRAHVHWPAPGAVLPSVVHLDPFIDFPPGCFP